MRQLLTEGLLLSALSGALGLIFARWGTEVLLGFLPQGRVPTVLEVKPDLRMLGFTFCLTALTGVLFALAPAMQATRSDLVPALKNEAVVVVRGAHGSARAATRAAGRVGPGFSSAHICATFSAGRFQRGSSQRSHQRW